METEPREMEEALEEGANIYEIPLRDTFTRFSPEKILRHSGWKEEEEGEGSARAARAAAEMELGGSKLYLSGDDMFGYLWRNLFGSNCNDVITIVVPGLRELFLDYLEYLDLEEQEMVKYVVENVPAPRFKNIYDYPELGRLGTRANVSEYQLFGEITPYDVVHFDVKNFVRAINSKSTIADIIIPNVLVVEFPYVESDFFDEEYQTYITRINLTSKCRD